MASEDRTTRTTPPSFAPGQAAQPVPSAGAPPIVVGQPVRPPAPPRPAPPAGRPASFAPASATVRPQDPAVEVGSAKVQRPVAPRSTSSGSPAPRPSSAQGSTAPRSIPPGSSSPSGPRSTSSHPGGRRPSAPPPTRPATPRPNATASPKRRVRWPLVALTAVVVIAALLAWPVGLTVWANGKVRHTDALSGAANTPGTTYLLTGSDSREDGGIAQDGTEGARTDTILLLQVPESGPVALISLPRDTYAQIPGHDASKLNAAFSWGGAPLLVQTVEGLTGLTVDHYAEIGMAGVEQIVTAVGGVNLCHDVDVNDADSGMVWTAGCHDVDGVQALAFARMRKADPTGDVGRAERQRQLISAVMGKVRPSSLVFHPDQQVALIDAGTQALTVSEGTGIVDMGKLALAFRAANGPDGITGTPPLKSLDYRPGNVGSTVLIDPDLAPAFWVAIRDGKLPAGTVGGMPTG